MGTKAIALRDHVVESFNVRTPTGRKARKDYQVRKGEAFPVVRQFIIRSGAYAGGRGLELLTPERRRLLVPIDFWALAPDNETETKCFSFDAYLPASGKCKVVTVTVCLRVPYASQDEAKRIAEICSGLRLKPTSYKGDIWSACIIENRHGVGVWKSARYEEVLRED